MDKLLKKILENYEFIFWMIILFGGGVVSWLKNRNQARQREEKARQQAHHERVAKPAPDSPGATASVRRTPSSPAARRPVRPRTARSDLESVLASMGLLPSPADMVRPALEVPPSPPLPAPEPLKPRLEGVRLQPGIGAGLQPMQDHEGLEAGRVLVSDFGAYDPGRMARPRGSVWSPPGDWRDAVILREVLGAPRAFAMEDLPGLTF